MAILSGRAIRDRLHHRELELRLFLQPLLVESEQLRDEQACVDIRLGTEFRFTIPARADSIDTLSLDPSARDVPYQRLYMPLGSFVVAHPHQLLLGQSLEYMRFPNDLAGYVVGRSSWGRRGLVVATAIAIHPGFSGILTLELRNLGDVPLRLYPGDTIAQLVVHDVFDACGPATPAGQFVGSTSPELGRMRYSITEKKLRTLTKAYKASAESR
jgi:dCTP deaminase